MKKNIGFKNKLDNKFNITKRGSNIKTEVIGGIINFLVMTYAMIVIPNILLGAGSTQAMWNAIYLATLLSIIFTTLMLALKANYPLVSAPGIGLASYFAVLLENGTYNFSQILTIALVAGILFVFLTLIGFREKLIKALPNVVAKIIPSAIGLFILNIGLGKNNSGIIEFLVNGPTHVVNGQAVYLSVVVSLVGLLTIIYLHIKKVKGAIFFGIVAGTFAFFGIQLIQGINPFISLKTATWLPQFKDLFNNTLFNFDFKGAFIGDGSNIVGSIAVASIIVFSYILVDLFDTVGTLFGATKNTSLVNEKGEIINVSKVFWTDSVSTVFGACVGVPGCTVYVESATGIKSGARTGLSSLITSLLFVLTLFISPIIMIIPTSATAPALIFVGMLMFSNIMDIDFNDFTQLVPAVSALIIMPITNNIATGIGVGIIMYVFVMLFSKKAKKINILTYILAIMFILFFATQNLL